MWLVGLFVCVRFNSSIAHTFLVTEHRKIFLVYQEVRMYLELGVAGRVSWR